MKWCPHPEIYVSAPPDLKILLLSNPGFNFMHQHDEDGTEYTLCCVQIDISIFLQLGTSHTDTEHQFIIGRETLENYVDNYMIYL